MIRMDPYSSPLIFMLSSFNPSSKSPRVAIFPPEKAVDGAVQPGQVPHQWMSSGAPLDDLRRVLFQGSPREIGVWILGRGFFGSHDPWKGRGKPAEAQRGEGVETRLGGRGGYPPKPPPSTTQAFTTGGPASCRTRDMACWGWPRRRMRHPRRAPRGSRPRGSGTERIRDHGVKDLRAKLPACYEPACERSHLGLQSVSGQGVVGHCATVVMSRWMSRPYTETTRVSCLSLFPSETTASVRRKKVNRCCAFLHFQEFNALISAMTAVQRHSSHPHHQQAAVPSRGGCTTAR